MSKLYLAISFVLIIGMSYFLINQYASKSTQHEKQNKIAIFAPAIHPAMDEIERGIKECLNTSKPNFYIFDTYNANGNRTLMRAQAEEIASNNYDCTFTIGSACTQMMFEISKKNQKMNPIVFTAIDDPVKMGIVQSLVSSGNHMTGSIIKDNFTKQFDTLLSIKPHVKSILFAYDPAHGSGLEKEKKEIEEILNQRGIKLKTVQVYQTNEIKQKVEALLHDIDVVFIYTDHTMVSGVDSLITLCNRYGITLYASDLSSGDKGAALSFGVSEYEHGINAARKAIPILEKQKKPSEVPITPVENFSLKINSKTMHMQGLNLSENELEKVRLNGAIIV